ncbi:translation initiation factor IF-2-like isoform X1 [Aquila chrysaetos chrysaetos]|uniref:translation initiation factor IF-2-like isoform X1 n=1 Tax=Aquila chrysaetos chrysaetos TaxID=223781 RepID=UPI001B7D2F86|nr:translation initiation factor IF-2-like isoform X1 [Aquila chrysaetos chrysaetos]
MAAVTCAAAHPPHTTTTPPSPGPVPDAARAGRPAQLPRGARPPFSRSARGPARPAAPAGLRAGGGKPLASPGSAAVPRGPLPPPPARGRRRRPAATRERSLSRPEPAARSGRPRGRRAPALPVPVGRRGTWRLRLRARLPAGSLQVWEPAFLCGNVSSSSWDLLSACTRLGQSSRSPAADGAVAAVLWMRPSGRRRDSNSHRPSALRSGVWQGWFDIGSGSPISGELKGKAQHRQARDISVPKSPQLCQKDWG